jgi:putative nucleotidyltransferase with HDIG domain
MEMGNGTILFVDDEEMVLKSLRRITRNCGLDCLFVDNGEKALRLLRNNHEISVVVADQRMPGIKGIDLLRKVKERNPEITRILLTGYADQQTAIDAINQSEVYRYLTKPWKPAELMSVIDEADKLTRARKQYQNFVDNAADLEPSLKQFSNVNIRDSQTYRIFFRQTVNTLLQAIDAKDHYTRGHSERVALFSKNLAIELGFSGNHANLISLGALLHDIGKLGVEDNILRKPTKLNTLEWEKIKLHPETGVNILEPLELPKEVVNCVLQHHERFDGSGYPFGLSGKSISLEAQVVMLADMFDSMSTNRIYRIGKPLEQIIATIEKSSDKLFDRGIVTVFMKMVKSGKIYNRDVEWEFEDHIFLYDLQSQ